MSMQIAPRATHQDTPPKQPPLVQYTARQNTNAAAEAAHATVQLLLWRLCLHSTSQLCKHSTLSKPAERGRITGALLSGTTERIKCKLPKLSSLHKTLWPPPQVSHTTASAAEKALVPTLPVVGLLAPWVTQHDTQKVSRHVLAALPGRCRADRSNLSSAQAEKCPIVYLLLEVQLYLFLLCSFTSP